MKKIRKTQNPTQVVHTAEWLFKIQKTQENFQEIIIIYQIRQKSKYNAK